MPRASRGLPNLPAVLGVAAIALAVLAGCGGRDSPSAKPRTKPGPPRANVAVDCRRYASPRGSDRARGTRRAPYRTARHLVRSLRTGQTGCLLRGTYRHRGVVHLRRPRTTLRNAPGARATVDGAIQIERRARGASVAGLRLTSHSRTFFTPVKVEASDARVVRNVIFGSVNSICVQVGGSEAAPQRVVIEENLIGRCSREGKLDHQIYLAETRDTVVRWNILTGNAGGWGVHLYPNADRTLVEHNVIDGDYGGVVFAGDGEETADGNVVRNNAITFSTRRGNLEGSWSGGPEGSGNVAYNNCLFSRGPGAPAGLSRTAGFAARGNTVLRGSPYRSRSRRDYRFRQDSPCRRLVGDVSARAGRR
jgi:hypothetical protein